MSGISNARPTRPKPHQAELLRQLKPNYWKMFMAVCFGVWLGALAAILTLIGGGMFTLSAAMSSVPNPFVWSSSTANPSQHTTPSSPASSSSTETKIQSLKNQLAVEKQRADMAEQSLALARKTITNQGNQSSSSSTPAPSYTPPTHRSTRSTTSDLTTAVNAYRTNLRTCEFWTERDKEIDTDRSNIMRKNACELARENRIEVLRIKPDYWPN